VVVLCSSTAFKLVLPAGGRMAVLILILLAYTPESPIFLGGLQRQNPKIHKKKKKHDMMSENHITSARSNRGGGRQTRYHQSHQNVHGS
jgi:hypothetical protein